MSLAWARLIFGALEAGGVRDVVVCPGSRSAPLALAAAESALRTTVIVDERSAAFFALGQARVTGLPSAIVCTSGTAGAHFFPALIEASLAAIPLIVITADRPPELHGCGAPQTIDQRGLYGSFVRAEIDTGCATSSLDEARALVDALARTVALARGPVPGPVHINAPARKPLLSDQPIAHIRAQAHPIGRAGAPLDILAAARTRLESAERPIVVVGPLAWSERTVTGDIARLALALAAPIFAEASSQLFTTEHEARHLLVPRFDELLRENALDADAVIEIGATPTSAGYARAIEANPALWRIALRPHLFADPQRTADAVTIGDLANAVSALTPTNPAVRAEGHAARWIEAANDQPPRIGSMLSGQAATAAVSAALRSGAHLVVGNSLPIRWLEAAAPEFSAVLAVHCQRGVAGIDGLVAGAAGTAAAAAAPTCLLLGDVSAAHDIGSLALAATATTPLAICVLDNRGGQIFSELPYAADLPGDTLARLFTTEPSIDFVAAAVAFGLEATTVTTTEEVGAAVASALDQPGATLIRIVVDPDSPRVLS